MSQRPGPRLSDEEARVLEALSDLRAAGAPTYKQRIAEQAGMPVEDVEPVLSELMTNRELVSELRGTDEPDLGPLYALTQEDGRAEDH